MFSLILHGRRSVELQKWRNLRVTVSILQNAFAFTTKSFSSAIAKDVSPKGTTFTVSYLVESLGLTKKIAESISKKVSFEDKVNPDSVLNLLRSNGFKDSQISRIIRAYPRLLVIDAEKSLRPKLQFLQSRGASSSEFTEIVSNVPTILGKKGEKSISLYYDFVKDIMEDGKSLCHSWPEGKKGNKIRNISVLRELGVPQRLLFPLVISNYQPVCGKEKFEETLKKVVDMGFDPAKSTFVEALHKWPFFLKFSEKKIILMFETLKKCGLMEEEVISVLKTRPQCIRASEQKILDSIETFLNLGFSRDEFKIMVKRYPQCTAYTAETVRKKFEVLVKKMNWPLEDVVLIPAVLGYSLEKRIVPRTNVIKALMSKGLIGSENPPISSVLVCTDQEFLKRYVMKHDKLVPKLMAIFTRVRVSK
ncbi:Transcription termination factor mitochondrial/chloroplastic [Arabidopsis thaliana x Arabidopsis arenosa]|uniref:Transcription termination factor mitochondrial/chloroplastic n=1 Tax=Arabidopsis thaliana x Arabidopsis arenosa TaxID=1240361 RepID=A0A8T1ZKL6_9BRAS|nr:Transcription termination factor mitochondrial/chloroplastic [Arabidopsis thaliana x Arabidopsis arenosa]